MFKLVVVLFNSVIFVLFWVIWYWVIVISLVVSVYVSVSVYGVTLAIISVLFGQVGVFWLVVFCSMLKLVVEVMFV